MSCCGTTLRGAAAVLSLCALAGVLGACGGGGGAVPPSSSAATAPQAANVLPVVLDGGPAAATGVVNTPYVSVTICATTGAPCQTIDHISVDTGSTGLRVISSVLSPALATALTQVSDAQSRPLVECLQFADGHSWGPVKRAQVKMAGEQANSLSIQVIGDPAFTQVPADCSSVGNPENTVAQFGANGILGIQVFQHDCGSNCALNALAHMYYACPSTGCLATRVPEADQVANPVVLFATDHNGTILELPSVSAAGAAGLSGSLIFGIDTESNNALGTATVLTVNPANGDLTVLFNNQSLKSSFIDSGSNGNFFPDSSLAACSSTGVAKSFYCPTSTRSLSATIVSFTGISTTVSFSVANAETLLSNNPSFTAYNNLAGSNPVPGSFDFGLPFFMGRNVYTAIEQQTTSAGAGPFVAF